LARLRGAAITARAARRNAGGRRAAQRWTRAGGCGHLRDMTSDIDRAGLTPEYWRNTPLDKMSRLEWEALCDGCGRCCLLKLEDEDSGGVAYTDVHCRLFDPDTCRCGNYAHRKRLVPGCVQLTPENLEASAAWMPETCAYRRLHEGRDLPDWHPLITGDPDSPQKAGMSMHNRSVPEWEVDEDDLEDHIIEGML
jgi:uncharacterized cysteine cluster protein YcgN (CxxCxxCC family)